MGRWTERQNRLWKLWVLSTCVGWDLYADLGWATPEQACINFQAASGTWTIISRGFKSFPQQDFNTFKNVNEVCLGLCSHYPSLNLMTIIYERHAVVWFWIVDWLFMFYGFGGNLSPRYFILGMFVWLRIFIILRYILMDWIPLQAGGLKISEEALLQRHKLAVT